MSRQKFLQLLSVHVQAKVFNFHKIVILTRKLLQLDLRSLLEGKWEVENFLKLFTKYYSVYKTFTKLFTAFYKTITAFTKLLQNFYKLFKALQNFYKTVYSLIEDPKHNFICVLCVTDASQISS